MNLGPLQTPCTFCDEAVLRDEESGRGYECPECEGTGMIPTAAGEAILDLVNTQLGYQLRAVARHERRHHG